MFLVRNLLPSAAPGPSRAAPLPGPARGGSKGRWGRPGEALGPGPGEKAPGTVTPRLREARPGAGAGALFPSRAGAVGTGLSGGGQAGGGDGSEPAVWSGRCLGLWVPVRAGWARRRAGPLCCLCPHPVLVVVE